jgi:hypothetical protein
MSPKALPWIGLIPLAIGVAGIGVTIIAPTEVGRWRRTFRVVGTILAAVGTAAIFVAFLQVD